jgi:hypothetical protein
MQFHRHGHGDRATFTGDTDVGTVIGERRGYELQGWDRPNKCVDLWNGISEQDCNYNHTADGKKVRVFKIAGTPFLK